MLDKEVVESVLKKALQGGADWAEIFMEDTLKTRLRLLNGEVKELINGNDYGAGLRVLYGHKVIYAYTNDCSKNGLLAIADAVSKAQKQDINGEIKTSFDFCKVIAPKLSQIKQHPLSVSKKYKIEIANKAAICAKTGFVKTVESQYSDSIRRILVANSDGVWAEDEQIRANMMVLAIAENQNERSMGADVRGATLGTEFFDDLVETIGKKAAEMANNMLGAKAAPAGMMPVILGSGSGGVIFHEACGHILETTQVAKRNSVFCDKIGEKIANDCVSAVDDGTIPGAWGAISIDDEGKPSERTVLIKNGILQSYMVDRVGEVITGYQRTGSARRQNYTFAPTSRMRSTFIMSGDKKPEELIKDVSFGLYAKTLGGGSVLPGTGEYNFSVIEGYLIRNGEICEPVKEATLIGNGAKDLLNIVGVANDLELSGGECGSASGWVPVDVGQPHILVSEINVGGQS